MQYFTLVYYSITILYMYIDCNTVVTIYFIIILYGYIYRKI